MDKREFLKAGVLAMAATMLPRRLWGLEFFPTTSPAEWAILYGTWCGTSRDASVWISEGMDGIADVFDVRESPDLSKYKHVIVGGSIRSSATPKALQEYLSSNKEMIKSRIRGLFAVCGNMRQPVTEVQYTLLIRNHLAQLTGAGADVPSKIFLGRITWGLMEPNVREQMRSFPGMEEYDNLKRSECMGFGREILQSVG